MRRRAFTDAQYLWLWKKYLEGYTLCYLCDAVFTHPNSLRYHFERMGLKPHNKGELPPLNLNEFYALGDKK